MNSESSQIEITVSSSVILCALIINKGECQQGDLYVCATEFHSYILYSVERFSVPHLYYCAIFPFQFSSWDVFSHSHESMGTRSLAYFRID
jgi:hypothetical protein